MLKKNSFLATDRPAYFVFFDVDETVISVKSMFSFLKFYFTYNKKIFKLIGWIRFIAAYYRLKLLAKMGKSRELINLEYYRIFSGKNRELIKACGEQWFATNLKNNKNFFIEKVVKELVFHKENNAKIVLISGSFDACLVPIAKYLGVNDILGANLEVINGKYTGNIIPPQTIGEGKAEAIKLFLETFNFHDLERCYAYADHISDLPILKLVGNPRVVFNCGKLADYAKDQNWVILYPDE